MASNRIRAGTVSHVTDPGTSRWVAALDFLRGRVDQAGHSGTVRIGLTGSPAVSYRGDLGPLQQFRGWSGPRPNLRGAPAMALPITGAPDPASGLLKGSK